MFIVYKMEHFNYIGSTHDLKHRQRNHIKNCYNKIKHYNFKVYKNIRKKNSQINLIEIFKYNGDCSRRVRMLVEQYYIEKYDSIKNGLNDRNSFTSKKHQKKYQKEYHEKNKDKKKEYFEKNKDKINKKKKEWYEKNKNKISKQCKKYCEEKIKKNKKEYYQKNKDKLRKKRQEKINCPICNSSVSRANLPRHQRSKKCKNFFS